MVSIQILSILCFSFEVVVLSAITNGFLRKEVNSALNLTQLAVDPSHVELWQEITDKIISEGVPAEPASGIHDWEYESSSGEYEDLHEDLDGFSDWGKNWMRMKLMKESFDSGGLRSTNDALGSPPKFMLELYEKFSRNRLLHPMANIVRSFVSTSSGEALFKIIKQ